MPLRHDFPQRSLWTRRRTLRKSSSRLSRPLPTQVLRSSWLVIRIKQSMSSMTPGRTSLLAFSAHCRPCRYTGNSLVPANDLRCHMDVLGHSVSPPTAAGPHRACSERPILRVYAPGDEASPTSCLSHSLRSGTLTLPRRWPLAGGTISSQN